MALKIKVEFQKLKSVLSALNLKAPLQFQNLSITDVLIDSSSTNLFFMDDGNNAVIINISESLQLSTSKQITDSMIVAEQSNLETALAKGDILSVSESVAIILAREFSESLSISESSVQDTELNKSDNTSIAENYISSFSSEKSDSYSVSESSNVVPNKVIGNPNTGSTITYIVTVASGVNSYGGGNKFYFNGGVSPEIDLELNGTYRFDQSHSSNGGHPLRFSTTGNGTHGGGSEYTTGVTVVGTAGQAGAYVEIDFDTFINSLHYYCAVHSGMGNKIVTRDEQSISISESFSKVTNYIRSLADTYTLDDTASASDDLATNSGVNKNNIVSIAESLARIVSFQRSFNDTPAITESLSVSDFNKSLVDTSSIAESLARIVNFQRTFNDASTITESLNVSDFVKSLADAASVVESLNISDFGKGLTDTPSITESLARIVSFQRSFNDTPVIEEAFSYLKEQGVISNSVSVSESIAIQLTSGANSVFNTSALNTYTINS